RHSVAPGRSRRSSLARKKNSRADAGGRSRCERASLVDNRFYKSMRDRLSQGLRLRLLPIAVPAALARGAPAHAPAPAASGATGNVVVSREGNVFFGPEVQLRVERFEGFFRSPTYRFARTDAGGKATLIEFIDDQRAVAIDATYTSCGPDDPEPAWILKAGRI